MTDRHNGYIVTLEQNIREDDAESTIAALRQIKGVLSVQPVVADLTFAMAEDRARHEIASKVLEVLRP
jgi:hypothetical protein